MKQQKVTPENKRFFESVKRAMPAAARRARKIAQMYGTLLAEREGFQPSPVGNLLSLRHLFVNHCGYVVWVESL